MRIKKDNRCGSVIIIFLSLILFFSIVIQSHLRFLNRLHDAMYNIIKRMDTTKNIFEKHYQDVAKATKADPVITNWGERKIITPVVLINNNLIKKIEETVIN